MKIMSETAEIKHPVREAERYLQNARQILTEKAGKEGNYYKDGKYVKMAGHTAWCGVLLALDVNGGMKKGSRPDIKDYQQAVSNIDKKMTCMLTNSCDTLHKTLGYDGNLSYHIVQYGLKEAQDIISWADKHYRE